jgi:hypothetical protein
LLRVIQYKFEYHAPKRADAAFDKIVQPRPFVAREPDKIFPVTGQEGFDRRYVEHVIAKYDANQKVPVRHTFDALIPIWTVFVIMLKFLEMRVSICKFDGYALNDIIYFHIRLAIFICQFHI